MLAVAMKRNYDKLLGPLTDVKDKFAVQHYLCVDAKDFNHSAMSSIDGWASLFGFDCVFYFHVDQWSASAKCIFTGNTTIENSEYAPIAFICGGPISREMVFIRWPPRRAPSKAAVPGLRFRPRQSLYLLC